MISAYKVLISIPLVINCLCILVMMRKRSSTEQKYAMAVSFLTIFIARGYYLYLSEGLTQAHYMGLKIIYAIAIVMLPMFIQINFLLFNVRLSRKIFTIVSAGTMISVFMLILSYDSDIFSNSVSRLALTLYYVYTISMVVFTVAIFLFRMITCRKNERLFFIRHFFFCILPLLSLCLINVNRYFFMMPLYMLTFFVMATTVLVVREKFSNLSDLALSVVENAVSGPCFIIDENLMVHDANLSAVQMFPEYISVRKLLKKPVKANDLLLQVIFNAENNGKVENSIFEFDNKQYQGYCVSIKSDYRFYGYTVVLKDITEQRDVVYKLEKRNEQQKQILRYYEDEISSIQSKIVSGLMHLILVADKETGEHIRRVSNYTSIIARQLLLEEKFINKLTKRYVEILIKVSPLHDVGKLKIAKGLANNHDLRRPLSDADVQRHVVSGVEIIDSLIVNNPDDLFYTLAKEVALYHHEWWDGEGYPKGLKGYEIPLSARIVALADVFDNISFNQYKETHEANFSETFESVVMYSGKRFDPEIIESFKNVRSKIEKVYEEMVVDNFSIGLSGGGVYKKK